MKKKYFTIKIVLLSLMLGSIQFTTISVQAAGPNDYFNVLTARSDIWRSNSLRNQSLIDSVSLINPNTWVTYNSTNDAAKAAIPAWGSGLPTVSSVGSDRITFSSALTTSNKNNLTSLRGLKIDNEIFTVIKTTFGLQFLDGDTTLLVNRAQFGTTAASHSAGTPVYISQNNLYNYLRIPLGTSDGNTYLFTWDIKYDSSYLGTDLNVDAVGHKEFQFTTGPRGGVWLETREVPQGSDWMGKVTGFDRSRYVGLVDSRYYGTQAGPGFSVGGLDAIGPQIGRFYLEANKWTRFWWYINQQTNDWDLATLWISDEDTAPLKIFDSLPLKVNTANGTTPTIFSWWLEQNTSYDLYRGAERDLVSYVKNFAALQNPPSDVSSLLVQPVGGASSGGDTIPPTVSISSPTNGATISGTATISATANDNVGIYGVQFKLDGANLGSEDFSAPFTTSLNTTSLTNGSTHTLSAIARDLSNNSSTSSSITVTINNIATSPPPSTGTDMSISANPTTISSGGSSTLSYSWNVATRHNVRLNGAAPTATCDTTTCSGSMVVSPTATTSYTLTAVYSDSTVAPSASTTVTVGAATTLVGDLNKDSIVNSVDWSVMNSKWFTSDVTADLNKDSLVNTIDWSVMNTNWLKTG